MFRHIRRAEFSATNGNTIRLDIDADGNLKLNARKGDHNQSVSVIPAADVAAVVAFLKGKK